MTRRTQDLLREALTLSESERADLAAELLASLDAQADDPKNITAAWAAEIERRARRILKGESAGEPWSVVRQQIGARLQER